MPPKPKSLETTEKHLTTDEKNARAQAESEIMPVRTVTLKVPRSLSDDSTAKKYWRSILKRMEGLAILDDLDSEMLAVYCTSLSRRDSLNALCRDLIIRMEKEPDPYSRLELTGDLDTLVSKLQAHEKTLLQYADKLGMTPESRIRMARKRAAAVELPEPEDGMFGD